MPQLSSHLQKVSPFENPKILSNNPSFSWNGLVSSLATGQTGSKASFLSSNVKSVYIMMLMKYIAKFRNCWWKRRLKRLVMGGKRFGICYKLKLYVQMLNKPYKWSKCLTIQIEHGSFKSTQMIKTPNIRLQTSLIKVKWFLKWKF